MREGADVTGRTVVCIITGNGLKDPGLVNELAEGPPEEAPADVDAVARLLDDGVRE